MKICEYIKCDKKHSRNSLYCSGSCKTRQWEINNNKKPFLSGKNEERVKQYHANKNKKKPSSLTDEIMKNFDISNGYSYQTAPVYKSTIVAAAPSNYKMVLPALPVAAAIISKKKIVYPQLVKWVGIGFAIGALVDYLRPKHIEQNVLVEESKTVYVPPVKKKSQRLSSSDYANLEIERLGLRGKYQKLFGDPSKDFYMIVDGKPGHGKSWWAAEFANHIEKNHGTVIYYAAEQNGENLAFQEMVKTLKTSFEVETKPHTMSIEQIEADMKKYSLVVMDSVSEMGLTPKDLKDLRKKTNCAVIGILHSTKDGLHKGSQEWLHDVDVSINIVRYEPQLRKSRFKKIGGADLEGSGRVVNM